MIELKVEEYCQECRAFEPAVLTETLYMSGDSYNTIKNTVVCVNAKKCEGIARYLRRQLKDE